MESHFQITHLHPLWRAADLPPAAMHDYPKQLHAFNEEGSVHDYHYLRIGQLCDGLPVVRPELSKRKPLPAYHFPDASFSGFTAPYDALDRRHVLEVCPFRAWSLVLHKQKRYSLANAYNLGLMSILSYSNEDKTRHGAPAEFFARQCLDMS
ncbi:hypothetical protein [Pseudomonas graminis]|nr:hypothetical protein [Pseudomonas graminis]